MLVYITAPPSLTSGPGAGTGATSVQKNSSVCLIPECTLPKYVDPSSGVTHDYCGKTHAAEGKRRGIRGIISYRKLIYSSFFSIVTQNTLNDNFALQHKQISRRMSVNYLVVQTGRELKLGESMTTVAWITPHKMHPTELVIVTSDTHPYRMYFLSDLCSTNSHQPQ